MKKEVPSLVRMIIPAMLLILNLGGLILVAADKRKASGRKWRVAEKWFFLISLAGGAPGVYAGLMLFRHKTRHWYFMWGIPAIFALQLSLIFYLMHAGILLLP